MSSKEKALTGVKWSLVGNLSNKVTTFIIGIVMARLLSPADFGLVGMIAVFLVLADTFVDSGFSQALIRKANCSQDDYSTTFYFNLVISLIVYGLLFAFSDEIAKFYEQPKLTEIIKVSSIALVLNAIVLVHQTILIKNIDFLLETKISVTATILSGTIALVMAFYGFGVWSLVVKSVSFSLISTISYLFLSSWRPSLTFSLASFNSLFFFGSKLLVTNLIDRLFWNSYYIVIGKYFSANTLGYYTRAEMFRTLLVQQPTYIVNKVTYPLLSKYQNNELELITNFRKLFRLTLFTVSYIALMLAVLGDLLIFNILGEKWLNAAFFLSTLSIAGVLFPASMISLMLLKVLDKTNLILKMEPIKKLFAVPSLLIGVFIGVNEMILFLVLYSIIEYSINAFSISKVIKHTFRNQFIDLFDSIKLPIVISLVVFTVKEFFVGEPSLMAFISLSILGLSMMIFVAELVKNSEYLQIKNMVLKNLKK